MQAYTIGSKFLGLIKRDFPEMYEKHMRGRLVAFIKENAPDSERFPGGREIGRVPHNLRLLCALTNFLFKTSKDEAAGCTTGSDTLNLSCCVNIVSKSLMGRIAALTFWECAQNLYGRQEAGEQLYLRDDWVLEAVPSSAIGTLQLGTVADELLHVADGLSGISVAAEVIASRN